MLPHLLTSFNKQKYYQSETKFDGVYSRKKLSTIKYGAYIIYIDE